MTGRSRKDRPVNKSNNVVGAKSIVTANHLALDSTGKEFKAKVFTGQAATTKNREPRFSKDQS